MGSFTDTAKSSVRVRKSSDKSIFPISQPNIHNSVSSQKSNTRTKIPVKFDKTRPTLKSSEVPSKVYLDNVNRVLRKDVLKPRSIATCNLTLKAAKIPHVKLDIRKLFNNQSPTVSPNFIRSLRLNTHNHPSHANIRKSSPCVTKLSHLKARNSARQKLHHDRSVDSKNVSTNHLRYKSNYLWWKYHVKKKLIFSSYLCEFLLLLIFLSNSFDFICKNNKQLYFVKMYPTMPNEYFFVSNSINKFAEVTTRDKQLLKLSKNCSTLINLSSVYVNLNFLYKKRDSFTWFQIAAIVWFLSLTLSKTKVLCRYLRTFIHFSLIFGKLMIASIVLFIYLLNKIVLNFKVFKLMAFLAFFIFLFSLLNANFIHTNILLYTNSYTNFVTRELCLRNVLAGINYSVQWELNGLLYFIRISTFRRMLLGISF